MAVNLYWKLTWSWSCLLTLRKRLNTYHSVYLQYHSDITSLLPGDAIRCHRCGSTLGQVMACRLFSTKPLPESLLIYCPLHNYEEDLMKLGSNASTVFQKNVFKSRLHNEDHFVQAGILYLPFYWCALRFDVFRENTSHINFNCPIVLKFCTEHGNDTVVVCAKFQNGFTTAMSAMDQWDLVLFEFTMRLARIFYNSTAPYLWGHWVQTAYCYGGNIRYCGKYALPTDTVIHNSINIRSKLAVSIILPYIFDTVSWAEARVVLRSCALVHCLCVIHSLITRWLSLTVGAHALWAGTVPFCGQWAIKRLI